MNALAKWKWVLIPAALGFGLSLLLNILNFSGWWPLIYRPLVSGAIWGIVILAGEYILKRYVPQVHEAVFAGTDPSGTGKGGEEGLGDPESAEFKGNNLDVTVGEAESSEGAHLFSGAADDIGPGPGLEPPPSAPRAPSRKSGEEAFPQDPQVIAKAVRTVMNK